MRERQRIIDLRDYFRYLKENLVVICLLLFAFTGAAAGYSFIKQKKIDDASKKSATENANAATTIEDIMNQNYKAYYFGGVKFTDANAPDGCYDSTARLFIDFDYDAMNGGGDYSPIISRYGADCGLLVWSEESLTSVIEELKLSTTYADMAEITPMKLKWMINKNLMGTNIFQIVITDVDADRALLINEAVTNQFMKKVLDFPYVKGVRVIDPPRKGVPSNGSEALGTGSLKTVIKFAVIGFVGSSVVLVVIYLIIFILKDMARTESDLRFAGTTLFGRVPARQESREEAYKRIANNLYIKEDTHVIAFAATSDCADAGEVAEQVAEDLKSLGKTVALISGEAALAAKVEQAVSAEKEKDYVLVAVPGVKEHADATVSVNCSDNVLLITNYKKTNISEVEFAIGEIQKTHTKLLGAVITGVK